MVLGNFHSAQTSRVFGAGKYFWYLGLSTARDLFISGEFSPLPVTLGYPLGVPKAPSKAKNRIRVMILRVVNSILRAGFYTKNTEDP